MIYTRPLALANLLKLSLIKRLDLVSSLVALQRRFSLVGVEIPHCDGVPCPVSRLHFVRVPPIWPEEDDPVELRLDVCHCRPVLREYSEENHSKISFTPAIAVRDGLPQGSAAFDCVPMQVQIVDSRDDAAVPVRVIHMQNVVGAVRRIASDHRLKKKTNISPNNRTIAVSILTLVLSRILYSPNKPLSFIRFAETVIKEKRIRGRFVNTIVVLNGPLIGQERTQKAITHWQLYRSGMEMSEKRKREININKWLSFRIKYWQLNYKLNLMRERQTRAPHSDAYWLLRLKIALDEDSLLVTYAIFGIIAVSKQTQKSIFFSSHLYRESSSVYSVFCVPIGLPDWRDILCSDIGARCPSPRLFYHHELFSLLCRRSTTPPARSGRFRPRTGRALGGRMRTVEISCAKTARSWLTFFDDVQSVRHAEEVIDDAHPVRIHIFYNLFA